MKDYPDPIRVMLVEDDREYSKVLEEIISDFEHIQVIGHFRNPIQFLSRLEDYPFDVVLMDIELPNLSGIECLKTLKNQVDCKVIMLTVYDDDDTVVEAFKSGADGYLLKDSRPEKIQSAIRDVLTGEFPMSSYIARHIISIASNNHSSDSPSKLKSQLTDREWDVLKALSAGATYSMVAQELSISPDTVKTHAKHIYEKLNVTNKTQAVALYLKTNNS